MCRNQARTLNNRELGGIPEKHGIMQDKGTECHRKEGVVRSVRCCQEIMEIKTESVYR